MRELKIGTVGHYDTVHTPPNGQTIRTVNVTRQLNNIYGHSNVTSVSTHNWKRRPFTLVWQIFQLARKSDHIIVFPDSKGVRVIVPLLIFLQRLYKFKLYYVVIGAWLPDLLSRKKRLLKKCRKLDMLFVQTMTLKKQLKKLGLKKLSVFPNFKEVEPLEENDLVFNRDFPLPLCFFSRVTPQKGIIELLHVINTLNGTKRLFTLDIYGPIDIGFTSEFLELINISDKAISYKGVIHPLETVEVLKNYYIQVFPTQFPTEGFPGSILDSFNAGVPVIVSRWNSCDDVVTEGETGLSFEFNNFKDLAEKLLYAKNNIEEINNMKVNCLRVANQYRPENIIKIIEDVIAN